MARVWRVDGQLVSSQAGIFVAGLFAAVLLGVPTAAHKSGPGWSS